MKVLQRGGLCQLFFLVNALVVYAADTAITGKFSQYIQSYSQQLVTCFK